VGSTIEFAGIPEELDTHIIARIFPDTDERFQGATELESRVRLECVKVANLLTAARRQHISATELYYFFRGYNQGYTSALSL
jgi:hypothetical protein